MEGNENGLDLTAHIIDLQNVYILARKFKSFIAFARYSQNDCCLLFSNCPLECFSTLENGHNL